MDRLRVRTARVNYSGPDKLDITRKSGGPTGHPFAPSAKLLFPALAKRRAGTLTAEDWAAYEQGYMEEMRTSYRVNRVAWDWLLQRGQVTLCCYCTDPARCHRTVLARILTRLGATYEGEAGHARDEHDLQELERWLRETFGDEVQVVRLCEVSHG